MAHVVSWQIQIVVGKTAPTMTAVHRSPLPWQSLGKGFGAELVIVLRPGAGHSLGSDTGLVTVSYGLGPGGGHSVGHGASHS